MRTKLTFIYFLGQAVLLLYRVCVALQSQMDPCKYLWKVGGWRRQVYISCVPVDFLFSLVFSCLLLVRRGFLEGLLLFAR